MAKVFLGGTCNESTWRGDLIPMLKIGYFNPVVDDWNKEAQEAEARAKAECRFRLYVITPKMTGVFAIAEVVQDSNRMPGQTIFCCLDRDGSERFTESQLRSLDAVWRMVQGNGAAAFTDLESVAAELNACR